MTPVVSVLIPAYVPAGKPEILAHLARAVRSVARGAPPQFTEVLVQDDCSPGVDSLVGVLPDFVHIERNARNLGFAANCNAGARRARGQYLFICNQDLVALGPWYAPLLATFVRGLEAGQRVGLVGPKLLFPPEAGGWPMDGAMLSLQSCGGWYDAALHPFHRWLGRREDYQEANRVEEVSWITGAAHFWLREAFDRIGGYDEAYQRGYFEDVDACCRVQEAGYRVWYCPEARFLHHAGSSGGVEGWQFRENAALFRRRWVDTRKVSKDVPVVMEHWWA